MQEMYTLAISRFDIPGDAGFPLNSVYVKPSSTNEAGKIQEVHMTSIYLKSKISFEFFSQIF